MPPIISAIFSLPYNIGEGTGNSPTYVISGNQSWLINPQNDKLIKQKSVGDRFMGLNILKEK